MRPGAASWPAESPIERVRRAGGGELAGPAPGPGMMVARRAPAGRPTTEACLDAGIRSFPRASTTGPSAVLSYGDCLAYGVALAERERLLFKGDDFARTDVEVVQY